MADPFYTECESCVKLTNHLKKDIEERDRLVKLGRNVTRINQIIEQSMKKLNNKILLLESRTNLLKEKPDKTAEDKKIKQFEDIKKIKMELQRLYENHGNPPQKPVFRPSDNIKYRDTIDKEQITQEQLRLDRDKLEGEFNKKVDDLERYAGELRNGQITMSKKLSTKRKSLIKCRKELIIILLKQ